MDKVFGPLKTQFEVQRKRAAYVQQRVSKSKVPILTRYAMRDISQEFLKDAFAKTGICPLSAEAISKDTLVGNTQTATVADESERQRDAMDATTSLEMDVESVEENNNSFEVNLSENFKTAGVQTDPIKSLPCSVCIRNDVSLHPAVQAGLVDIEFAAALLPDESSVLSNQGSSRTRIKRDCSKGRCLTAESEMLRLAKIKQDEQERERAKHQKKEEKEKRNAEKRKAELEAEREKEKKKIRDEKVQEISNIGRMTKGQICFSCSNKIRRADTVKCALCNKTFHKLCIGETSSINTICPLCKFVSHE